MVSGFYLVYEVWVNVININKNYFPRDLADRKNKKVVPSSPVTRNTPKTYNNIILITLYI